MVTVSALTARWQTTQRLGSVNFTNGKRSRSNGDDGNGSFNSIAATLYWMLVCARVYAGNVA